MEHHDIADAQGMSFIVFRKSALIEPYVDVFEIIPRAELPSVHFPVKFRMDLQSFIFKDLHGNETVGAGIITAF